MNTEYIFDLIQTFDKLNRKEGAWEKRTPQNHKNFDQKVLLNKF